MNKSAKIFVAGHRGMVGSAVVRKLEQEGYSNILVATRSELDLKDQAAVDAFFEQNKPEYVVLAAAKVGGIQANNIYRGDFILENLQIQTNVVSAAWKNKVEKLIFLGSSCIYPKLATQPLTEESLLTGFLEPTNEPYAIAKIAGLKLCESLRKQYGVKFYSLMPTNLYGPGDNYHPENSHVIPALIRKFMLAAKNGEASVEVWGSGSPKREFLHVDDLADAVYLSLVKDFDSDWLNVGVGKDISIKELAELIKEVSGFKGELIFDASKPDGTPRKLMDVSRIEKEGWQAKIELKDGLEKVMDSCRSMDWYLSA